MNQIDKINKDLEPIRLKAKRNSTILISLFVIDVLLMLSAIPTGLGTLGFIIPMFIVTVIAAFALRGPEKEYKSKAKYALSDYLFKPEFENYTFDPNGHFDSHLSRELSLHPLGDSFTSNDLITGTLQGINFIRADVTTTTTTTDSKGNSTTVTNFRGQVFAFDFFKNTNSYVKISDNRSGMGGVRRKLSAKKITFEDSEFNSTFKIHSNSDHEAFYVFTPQFMRRLIDFHKQIQYPMNLIIHNSTLYLSVYSNRDSFEPKIRKPMDEIFIASVKQDINIIHTIVEELDLKNTLFK